MIDLFSLLIIKKYSKQIMSSLFRENHFDKDKLIALRKTFSNAGH